jgi:hypothetical protein
MVAAPEPEIVPVVNPEDGEVEIVIQVWFDCAVQLPRDALFELEMFTD